MSLTPPAPPLSAAEKVGAIRELPLPFIGEAKLCYCLTFSLQIFQATFQFLIGFLDFF